LNYPGRSSKPEALEETTRPCERYHLAVGLVQQIGIRLLHWINFRGEPGCDDADVAAAMLIVHARSSIDPRVKGMLAHVQ
jgi:hypothetical protein